MCYKIMQGIYLQVHRYYLSTIKCTQKFSFNSKKRIEHMTCLILD